MRSMMPSLATCAGNGSNAVAGTAEMDQMSRSLGMGLGRLTAPAVLLMVLCCSFASTSEASSYKKCGLYPFAEADGYDYPPIFGQMRVRHGSCELAASVGRGVRRATTRRIQKCSSSSPPSYCGPIAPFAPSITAKGKRFSCRYRQHQPTNSSENPYGVATCSHASIRVKLNLGA